MRIFLLGEALAQVTQRGGRCSVPGNIQDQIGWSSEKPDLVEDVAIHCRGFELVDFIRAFHHNLFYDSLLKISLFSSILYIGCYSFRTGDII